MRCWFILTYSILSFLLSAQTALSQAQFTMSDAVAHALRDNKRVAAAGFATEAAQAGVWAARGAFGPALSTSYGASWDQKPPTISGVRRDERNMLWSLTLKQNLFDGFKNLSTWQRAGLESDSKRLELEQTRLDIVYQVQSTFLAYLKAQENIRSAKDALTRLQEQLLMTRAFYDEGLRPRIDVLQAEVDVSRAESLLIQATNNFNTQQAQLNTLLALDINDPAIYVGALDPVPFARPLTTCLESAFMQRPDLKMARIATDIAHKDKAIVRADYYPRLDAQVTWDTQGDTWRAASGRALETGYNQWAVGATATWSLFSWGTTYYADRQATHAISRLQALEENLRHDAAFEVKSRLLMVRDAEKRIHVAHKAIAQAREAYNQAVARYQSQVGTNIDVLDAQAKLSNEEANLTAAKAEYLSALSSLYAAMGEMHPDLT